MSKIDENTELKELEIDIPEWIDQTLTVGEIEAINQGGCASGAYMPAVTYYNARNTMNEHGDEVLDFIENHTGELPAVPSGESWSGIAVHYLSCAVELWASFAENLIEEKREENE